MAATESRRDPVQLTLVQNRLNYICRQMGLTMMRTALSPLFSQAHDFSCFVTDALGRVLAQADGVPIHTGGGGFAVRALLAAFGEDIHDGDAFVLNDPYAAGGNHLPDVLIARPVFAGSRLIAFCCNRAHQSDIGGGAPGSFYAGATEIHQEGLRIPPVRLVAAGEIRRDVWQLILLNSRTSTLMEGDLLAMLGSTRIGMEQVRDAAAAMGPQACGDYFEGVLEVGAARMRAEIRRLPPGTYRGSDSTDHDCFTPGEHTVRVALTVRGDEMTVDFTGTDPQMRGFKNSSYANTCSAVYVALSTFLSPDLPGNEGVFRAVKIVAPEGTLVNPLPPAPVAMSTLCVASEIIHAVWKALGEADPDRSCAGWGKINYPIMSGFHADGSRYVLYHWSGAPGAGAVQGRDGFNANGGVINLGALHLPDVELYESSYPVRFLRVGFRSDSAGAGRYRGGTGIDYAMQVPAPTVLALRGEGLWSESGYGAGGGRYGAAGDMRITLRDGRKVEVPKYGVLGLDPMTIEIQGAGGGGWGDPLEREPEAVLRDVRDGVVTPEAAAREYGIAVSASGREIDRAETAKLRGEKRIPHASLVD